MSVNNNKKSISSRIELAVHDKLEKASLRGTVFGTAKLHTWLIKF